MIPRWEFHKLKGAGGTIHGEGPYWASIQLYEDSSKPEGSIVFFANDLADLRIKVRKLHECVDYVLAEIDDRLFPAPVKEGE